MLAMTLARIRYDSEEHVFTVEGGGDIYVTNKYGILSGPEQWLAPVALASLAKAIRAADTEDTRKLFISTDAPDRFDSRYPDHLLNIQLQRAPDPTRVGVLLTVERPVDDEDEGDVNRELSRLLTPLVQRHRGSGFEVTRNFDAPQWFEVSFNVSTRGKTVADALSIGREVEALLGAVTGGRLSLQSAIDLVRAGKAATLIGLQEGSWFDGKSAPYLLATDAQRWELAKEVASFANSEQGGLILIGARTKSQPNGDVVQSVCDFELSRIQPGIYRRILAARVHPRVEGLEVRTVSCTASRGIAYIHIPPQRDEIKPFVVKGVVVAGDVRGTHVSIPVRDGEDTRYADPAEIHSLLQAGRMALRQR
jgi:hypothetical protein